METSKPRLLHCVLLLNVFFAAIFLLLAGSHHEAFAGPVVTIVDPAAGSSGIPSSSKVHATFTESLNPQTVNKCNASLTRASKVTNISTFGDHILSITSDGAIWGWGGSTYGETIAPVGLSAVASVSIGGSHSLALKSDGTVAAWGSNAYGQSSVPSGLSNVVAIAAGERHSAALKSDGTVIEWGDNSYGQSSVPAGLSGVVAIAAGDLHTLALKSDGTVVAWGYNYDGQVTVPTGLAGVTAIAAGANNSAAVKTDGTVVVWGMNYTNNNNVPAGLTGVAAIAVGGHVVALKSDGSVVAWGNNNYGQARVPAGLSDVIAVSAGGTDTIVLKSDGTIVAWGYNSHSQDNIPQKPGCFSAVSVGGYHSTAINPDGTITAWGSNLYGQANVPTGLNNVSAVGIGEGVTVALKSDGTVVTWGHNSKTPPAVSGVTAIAVGGFHALALKPDATVVSWGTDYYGETMVPAGLNGVSAIAAGFYHSLALKADGSLVAWGNNGYGQVSIPAGLNNVTSIAAGMDHNVAVRSDGTVAAWGSNSSGQATVPAGLSGVRQVAAGDLHSVALKTDGTVIAWGDSTYGQTAVPAGLTDVVAVAAGNGYTLALKSGGTVVGWGDNRFGQATLPKSPYGTPLNASVSWDPATLTVTLLPEQPFPLGATVNAALSGAIENVSGERIAPYNWSFSVADSYRITSSVSGGAGGSINCTPGSPAPGQDATCGMSPDAGYALSGLTDNSTDVLGAVTAGSYLIPAVSGDHTLSATFVEIGFPMTVSLSGTGGGVVHSSPAPDLACAAGSCGQKYLVGTTAILTAMPNSNSFFVGWGGDCAGAGDCSVAINAPHSVTATFELKSGVPAVAITSPAAGPTNNRTPVLQYSVNNGSVVVTVDGIVVAKAPGDTLGPLADGAHTVRVESTAGDKSNFAEVIFTVDTIPPVVFIDPVAPTKTNSQIVTGTRETNAAVSISVTAPATVGAVTYPTATTWNCLVNSLAEGDHTVTLTASDAASNSATTAIAITRDTVVPIVAIASPTAGPTSSHTPLLAYTASDGNVAISMDGVVANKVSGDYLDTLADGIHTVRVESRDTAGNVGFAVVTFVVDTTPPQQTVFSKVSAGTRHTIALKSDGTLWSWGYNAFGQLGDGTTVNRYVPVQIGDDNKWISISAGVDFTLALKSDGTLWGWGRNDLGQLGDGTTTFRYSPVQIGNSTDWISIHAGGYHAAALKSDGTLWAWGGQL
ncbi:RCC1 domain-containing protein [Citrifermentans bemidjiense]|uniref:RCC1 domain-containing protein n=1 Tax=Citrifermentans bemidjiense TaxID=225194 RepID=UPI00017BFA36|nr:hypothetical protein [Citrifermentans bemidjiense]